MQSFFSRTHYKYLVGTFRGFRSGHPWTQGKQYTHISNQWKQTQLHEGLGCGQLLAEFLLTVIFTVDGMPCVLLVYVTRTNKMGVTARARFPCFFAAVKAHVICYLCSDRTTHTYTHTRIHPHLHEGLGNGQHLDFNNLQRQICHTHTNKHTHTRIHPHLHEGLGNGQLLAFNNLQHQICQLAEWGVEHLSAHAHTRTPVKHARLSHAHTCHTHTPVAHTHAHTCRTHTHTHAHTCHTHTCHTHTRTPVKQLSTHTRTPVKQLSTHTHTDKHAHAHTHTDAKT